MVLFVAVLLGLGLSLVVYAAWYQGAPRTTFSQTTDTSTVHTTLPGFVDRTLGNLTRWQLVTRLSGYEDSAALRAIHGSGNPWQISLTQYYVLVVLSGLAFGAGFAVLGLLGMGVAGLTSGDFSLLPVAAAVAFVVGALVGSRLPLSLMRSKVNKRHKDVLLHLHEALDLFSMGTTTGASLPQAMELVYRYLLEGQLRDEIGLVCDDLSNGVPFATAIQSLYDRNPSKRMLTFVRLLKDVNADGKDRTARLRREAAEMREDQQRTMEGRAQTVSMVTIGAIVFGLLPLVTLPFAIPMFSQGSGLLGGAL